MIWTADAPANIALIKYMGKTDAQQNRPTNSSLSYTLNHLKSYVEIEANNLDKDIWEPLSTNQISKLELSEAGKNKFLKHFNFLKDRFNVNSNFTIRSGNSFPDSCGLASSASSFAALTLCSYKSFSELKRASELSLNQLSELSKKGSGSSCRSFFTPWAVWHEEGGAEPIELPYKDLIHAVVVVNQDTKKVSSSQAHLKVAGSLLFQNRPERANQRFQQLCSALQKSQWNEAFEITWSEFWDMHALFETSQPSFGYMTADSLFVLHEAKKIWETEGTGPLVTMDAGPNVHVLFKSHDTELFKRFRKSVESFKVISSLDKEQQ